jgi:hypothetical protein
MSEHEFSNARWRKSSHSGGDHTQCVEVAVLNSEPAVATRDSKNPAGGTLRFSVRDWSAFLAEVKAGRFDLV